MSVGGDGSGLGPLADGLNVFGTGNAEWPGPANLSQQDFGGQFPFPVESGVKTCGDCLLDFGAGETLARGSELRQIESRRIARALFEAKREKRFANIRCWQIDKENLVKAPF